MGTEICFEQRNNLHLVRDYFTFYKVYDDDDNNNNVFLISRHSSLRNTRVQDSLNIYIICCLLVFSGRA